MEKILGQRYGVLAQVYRTGDNYEYVAPLRLDESVINGNVIEYTIYNIHTVRTLDLILVFGTSGCFCDKQTDGWTN